MRPSADRCPRRPPRRPASTGLGEDHAATGPCPRRHRAGLGAVPGRPRPRPRGSPRAARPRRRPAARGSRRTRRPRPRADRAAGADHWRRSRDRGAVGDSSPSSPTSSPGRRSRPGPRGCPSSPAGSGRGCRCPSSSHRGGDRRGPRRPGAGRPRARSRPRVRRDQVEHRALEQVGAGVDLVGVDLGGVGLLEELGDLAVLGAPDEAVRARVVDRVERDRRPRAGRARAGRPARSRSRSQRTSPLRTRKRSPSCVLGEADRPGGAARLGLRRRSGPRGPVIPSSASRTPSARWPQEMTTSSTPCAASQSIT